MILNSHNNYDHTDCMNLLPFTFFMRNQTRFFKQVFFNNSPKETPPKKGKQHEATHTHKNLHKTSDSIFQESSNNEIYISIRKKTA